ncbi:helix-turn-helix transcriptional regulator [Streptomyces sp. V4I23]|uniref:helix-turn-helix domain-containing protein n=1 Tax=Streptomyces sp. V4I23 TaxID=3042282 RepID=UPI0027D82955|nr:helix-turn-helix transcriptional regulator [Streptomyces sp. V4I23]
MSQDREMPPERGGDREPDQLVWEMLESARVAVGLTRKDLAQAMDVHPRTLRNWMKHPSKLTAEQIERLARPLRISAENIANLHRLTTQRPALPTASELQELPDMEIYRRLVDHCLYPSLVSDYTAENIHINSAFRDLFASVAPHAFASPLRNGPKYILFHPQASDVLGTGDDASFREYWLMPALAHFLAAWQQRPEDGRLLHIKQEIMRRPKARRAFEATPDWIVRSGDIHVNSTARPFRDPRSGDLRTVHIVTEGHPGYQPLAVTHTTWVLDESDPRPVRRQRR